MDRALIKQLREEIVNLFPGQDGRARLALFLQDAVDFNFFRIENGDFSVQVNTVLTLLRADDRLPELLDALLAAHPAVIAGLHEAIKAALGAQWPDAEVRKRRQKLGIEHLICAQLPFVDRRLPLVDRKQLRALLDDLFDPDTPARVGVVTGVDLCGKTWSRNLIKHMCKLQGHRLVELDLEMSSSDDPKSLCETLLRRLRGREDIAINDPDTKSGQFTQRLVNEVITHRSIMRNQAEQRGEDETVVITIDSLNKNAGAPIVDFVEQLIQATRNDLVDTKLVLFGFPREIERFGFIVRPESLHPLTGNDIDQYLIEVGAAIGLAMSEAERGRFVENAVALTMAAADTTPDARRRALDTMSSDIRLQVERLVRA